MLSSMNFEFWVPAGLIGRVTKVLLGLDFLPVENWLSLNALKCVGAAPPVLSLGDWRIGS